MGSPFAFPASGVNLATESFAGIPGSGGSLADLDALVTPAHQPVALVSFFLRNTTGDIILEGADYPMAGGLGRVMAQIPNAQVSYVTSQSAANISIQGAQVRLVAPTGPVAGTWTLFLQYLY